MLLGPDRERYIRLVNVNASLVRQFKKAQEVETDSYKAFKVILDSTVPVASSVMEAAQQAVLLEIASKAAVGKSWDLRESARNIGNNPEKRGEYFSIENVVLGARLIRNPSFVHYPELVDRTVIEGSRVGLAALLTEIEGDPGFAQLTVTSQRSFGFIMPEAKDTSLGKAYMLETRIPGFYIGYTFNSSQLRPETHLIIPQLHTQRVMREGPPRTHLISKIK